MPAGFGGANDPASCRVAAEAGEALGFEQVLRSESGGLAFSGARVKVHRRDQCAAAMQPRSYVLPAPAAGGH